MEGWNCKQSKVLPPDSEQWRVYAYVCVHCTNVGWTVIQYTNDSHLRNFTNEFKVGSCMNELWKRRMHMGQTTRCIQIVLLVAFCHELVPHYAAPVFFTFCLWCWCFLVHVSTLLVYTNKFAVLCCALCGSICDGNGWWMDGNDCVWQLWL